MRFIISSLIIDSCIMNILENLKATFEKYGFGVCQYLGEKMGIKSSLVRLYFIYLSFMTLGSPLVIYLFMAFWVNVRKYVKRGINVLAD